MDRSWLAARNHRARAERLIEDEGRHAFLAGVPIHPNPYGPHRPLWEAVAWARGWNDAQREQENAADAKRGRGS